MVPTTHMLNEIDGGMHNGVGGGGVGVGGYWVYPAELERLDQRIRLVEKEIFELERQISIVRLVDKQCDTPISNNNVQPSADEKI